MGTQTQLTGLKVIKQKGLCSIQDLGRISSQHLGFSASGAADEYAFLFAHALLSHSCHQNNNNHHNSAALEITLGQITFQAEQNCTIAITGANCAASINNKPINNWQAHHLSAGDILQFLMPKKGLHTYLAIAGGIQNTPWLNSRSQTSTETALGFSTNTITVGSVIPLCSNAVIEIPSTTLTPSAFYNTLDDVLTLRFIPQALYLALNEKEQQVLCEHTFTLSPNINRMGYRLSALPENISASLHIAKDAIRTKLSKPVTYGTIQLPNNHQPIVLMKERQTIGGYPVIGSVIQTDLFKLSQLRPGNRVQFIPTTVLFAQQQLSAMYQRFL